MNVHHEEVPIDVATLPNFYLFNQKSYGSQSSVTRRENIDRWNNQYKTCTNASSRLSTLPDGD